MIYKTLIVGLGNIGLKYDLNLSSESYILSHSRAVNLHSSYELIGGVDFDLKNRETFESLYSQPAFDSLEDALSLLNPDFVIISVPTQYHASILQKILRYSKPKAILCEKPLAYHLEEANEILISCKEKNILLFVNFIRRYDPGVKLVKNLLSGQNNLDDIKGVCWYTKGFFNNASHFLNLLEYWLGDFGEIQVLQTGRMWNEIDPEPDILIQFKSGSVFFLAAKEENYSHYTIELVSSKGRLYYSNGGEQIEWQTLISDPVYPGYTILNPSSKNIPNEMNKAQWNVLDQISNHLKGNFSEVCTGDDAFRVFEILNKVKEML